MSTCSTLRPIARPKCCRSIPPGVAALAGLLLATLLLPWDLSAAQSITTATLIDEMTDFRTLAELPDPSFTCRQFSSYDRKAKSPQEDWFANGDSGQYLRVEERDGRKEHVMMDADGPGAIVRIWSANPAGNLRIYLDGHTEPAINAPMSELLGGSFPGLPRPIAGEYSKGWNLYFPIPYARHCKITSDQGGFYYHVNYRTYAEGTAVQSFRPAALQELATPIEQLAIRLQKPQSVPQNSAAQAESFEFEIPAGQEITESLWGPSAISSATLTVDAANPEVALRGVVLRITFDGEPTVESPLGDFFGSGPGLNVFATLPCGMTEEGRLYCHWFMPFRESARIQLLNTTAEPVRVAGKVALSPYTWSERSTHFHAKWHAAFDVPSRPMIDWNYLTAQGRGTFVGVSFSIDNPVKDWWGEGDEKIYVDGENFPSHFGTGTEDYYGYAWCWPERFTHAYHSQSRCDGPGNYGRTSVNRFHILDRIPFQKDFRFDMELWHWNEHVKVNMAALPYWYARPGSTDACPPIKPADLQIRPMPEYVVPRVEGAVEGESMTIIQADGTADPQDWDGLSGGRQLWWHVGVHPGAQLTLAFPAPKAGLYRVKAHFLKAPDYGIHQLTINGQPAGKPIDFYHPTVAPTDLLDLGTFNLRDGLNRFTATAQGANEKAVKSYMLGFDYLLLEPAK